MNVLTTTIVPFFRELDKLKKNIGIVDENHDKLKL